MLKNYFKIALRNLTRNKTFTAINIAGLAIGIAVFILIFEYIAAEWNTNRFNKHFSSLYRVGAVNKKGEHDLFLAPGFAPFFQNKISGIKSLTRVTEDLGNGLVSYTDDKTRQLKSFREENICFADSNFLETFSFPLVNGTAALKDPKTSLMSETVARKLFGTTAIAGRTITISNQFGTIDYTVSGVFEDIAKQSDIKPGIILSLATLQNAANRNQNDWADPATLDNGFVNYYLVLEKANDVNITTGKMNALVRTMHTSDADNTLVLQPFSEMHLAPGFSYPLQTYGSIKLVTMLLGVALLILLIAWVNYINLSTVQAMRRAKETGVRKVMGASRLQLTVQYLTETLVITLVSVGISFFLVKLSQDIFNSFTGKRLSLKDLNHGWFWSATVIFILIGSLLSGGYVAFVLSSFKPVTAIRGGTAIKGGSISLRKSLVVFQFAVSIIFIISTLILYRQLEYMKTTDLGLNLKQLLIINGPATAENRMEKSIAFKNELAKLSFVKKLTASNDIPGKGYNYSTDGITSTTPAKGDDKKSYRIFISDENFFDTYDIKFAWGKTFPVIGPGTKSNKIILNEKAAAELGFAKNENLTGQKINWNNKQYEIEGVVKDYHHLSLQNAIEPIIFTPSVSSYFYTIQTGTDNLAQKIGMLGALYRKYFSGNPYEYFFADETFNKQYAAEQQLGNVFIAAATVAIMIACLGLFGLAAFTAQQRTKEIGIRKVLGASVASIATLLSLDFLKLVFIAILIAVPVSWWAGSKWLQDFAYRTDLAVWIFVMAGILALLIAIVTISFQAIKAAVANPIQSLRTE